mgnify:CR=1 FL=1
MLQNAIPFKTIILLISLVLILLIASIISIIKYDTYAYETTTILSEDNWVKVYADSIDHGNSRAKKINELPHKGFDCTIKEGTDHPYCIMLNWISANEFQGMDLSKFNIMRIHGTYESPNENDFLRISLRNFDFDYTQIHKVNTYKYNTIEIQKKDISNVIEVDLSQLIVPHWWISLMRGVNTNNLVEIDNVPLIEISTGTHATFGDHKLRISKIEFDSEIISIETVYEYIVVVWGLFIFTILTILSIYFAFTLRIKIRNENNLIQINQALAKRSKELEYVNKTDELTGVLNRAGMQAKMLECIDNHVSPITLVMIDIDFFKSINDTLGHHKGDVVLNTFGKILISFTKSNESVSRFGGEEFIFLIQNQTTKEVFEKIERLRQYIEEYDFNIDRAVTASFGIATATDKIDFKTLIEKADNALYVAKSQGRNCIKCDNNL